MGSASQFAGLDTRIQNAMRLTQSLRFRQGGRDIDRRHVLDLAPQVTTVLRRRMTRQVAEQTGLARQALAAHNLHNESFVVVNTAPAGV